MEELRSDAKGLAFMNLFAPLVLMVLVFFSMSAFVPLRDGIKVHVGFMSFAELIVYIPYFLMWFNFLESLKNSYEDNETMVTAVKMGKAAMLVKIIAIVVGILASLAVIFGNGVFVGNVDMDLIGICPSSKIVLFFRAISLVSFILIAVMYLLFSENTEHKSSMKYITIALAALSVISAVTNSRTESSYLWGIVMVGCQLLEFLFLYRIYKGFEFKS